MYRRLALLSCTLLPLLSALPGPALAQDYPSRPVRMVVPYAPGGTTDLIARIIAQSFQAEFGQPLVVELRPGASGTIGSGQVAAAAPDGETLLMGTPSTHATAAALYRNLNYDQVTSFAPIVNVARVPNILVVNPNVPARTVAELIALAKARPDSLFFGSAGTGATTHLSGELFRMMTGAPIVHAPYRGSGAALIDLQAGQIQIMFENLPTAINFVREGRLRALAVTSLRRAQTVPDLPTLDELGLTGFDAGSWFAVFAPAGTPAPIVQRLNEGLRRIIAQPAVQQRLRDLGAEPADGPPEELAQLIRTETERWSRVIREIGITLQ